MTLKNLLWNVYQRLRKYILIAKKINHKSIDIEKQNVNGFVYIVFGESFTKEALFSIMSLKRFHDEPVAVFTDSPDVDGLKEQADFVYTIKPNHIRAKVDYIASTPFENTIYLDSDTVIVQNISDIFDLLGKYDVAFTMDAARKRDYISNKIKKYAEIPYSFSEVNGGVFAFNSSQNSLNFLSKWKEYFYKFYVETNGWDQPSLRISLWDSGVSLVCLPPEYNVRPTSITKKAKENKDILGRNHMEPRIYHMHYSPEIHQGKFEIDTLEELQSIVKEKSMEIIY